MGIYNLKPNLSCGSTKDEKEVLLIFLENKPGPGYLESFTKIKDAGLILKPK